MNNKNIIVVFFLMGSASVNAYTQIGAGGLMPMGHEWLTRSAALELLEKKDGINADRDDPRTYWTEGLAKNIDISKAMTEVKRIQAKANHTALYKPKYDDIYAAIVGERWVDIAGFNVTHATADQIGVNCFNAVPQEPAAFQQDHFMRRYDDVGGQGGVDAAIRAQKRFISHFVNAALAEKKRIKVWDGGGYAEKTEVDYNYFLFGRAAHLFQDSFSREHTVRREEDQYKSIRQVKAYLCSEGAEQHTHSKIRIINFKSGDVIWTENSRTQSGWYSYRASNINTISLVALEASKDLWAAFIRTMAINKTEREEHARQEAQALVDNWLSFDEKEMRTWYDNENNRDSTYVLAPGETGVGKRIEVCMQELNVGTNNQAVRVAQLEKERRQCLYNIEPEPGYEDLHDQYIGMPYNWRWKWYSWQTPPTNWKIPTKLADLGQSIVIKSGVSQLPISASELNDNSLLKMGHFAPVKWIKVPVTENRYFLRSQDAPSLFFSYSGSASGYGKLFSSPENAEYELIGRGHFWNIKNTHWQQYVWHNQSSENPELSFNGHAGAIHSRWLIEESN